MKTSYTAAIVLALASLATSQAMAAYTPTDARDNKDDITGMTYNPLTKEYKLGRDTDVNYLVHATKAEQA